MMLKVKDQINNVGLWEVFEKSSVLVAIYLTSQYSFLLFHSVAEIFSVLIAGGIFIFAWNSREYFKNGYFLFLGIAYLFTGIIDLTHTLAFKGMGVFVGFGANLPTQLWIAARYLEAISLLVAFLFLKRTFHPKKIFLVFLLITILLFGSIFYWNVFPVCFKEGSGLTTFKVVSEYIVSMILLAVIFLLYHFRSQFDAYVYNLLVASAVLTIIAELAFTFYISVYGFSILFGHFFKIISFYLIYRAVIKTGLKKPYDLLFRNVKQNEEELQKANLNLNLEITERKKVFETLQDRNEYIETIIENLPIGFAINTIDDGDVKYMNNLFEKIYGWPRDILTNTSIFFEKVFPDPDFRQEMQTKIVSDMESGDPTRMSWDDLKIVTKAGEVRYVHAFNIPIIDQNFMISTVQDVTARKIAEDQIKASLTEKDTLLHEIHHRVKNNMQVISSLLNLQSNSVKNQETKMILLESQSRIHAMAAVHESLHDLENLSEINLQTYLSKVTTSIFQTYSVEPGRVILINEIESIPIRINQASPLGLIINELISNALKYAFPDDRKGQITVKTNNANGELELTVVDDGVGFPEGLDWRNTNSLGLKLVRSLAENQLGGSIDMEGTSGTRFTIKFNIEA